MNLYKYSDSESKHWNTPIIDVGPTFDEIYQRCEVALENLIAAQKSYGSVRALKMFKEKLK